MADSDTTKRPINRPTKTTSLGTDQALSLATITKSAPQMEGIASRWLLKMLPWVQVRGGAYQVNRVADLDDQKTDNIHKQGPGKILSAAGHKGEHTLRTTFADYFEPKIIELSIVQTILRVHTRVADLYNDPMNQTEEQLKLTVEALRERQEDEMINNGEFGLLHQIEIRNGERIRHLQGPPTPDDFDNLITSRRDPHFILAHPLAIAAFGQECNKRGLHPQSIDMGGHLIPTWRGIPVLPCNKIPISKSPSKKAPQKGITSILVMRTGENNQGVIGLNQTGIPDEYEPGLNVRFMGIDEKAVISYLVTLYFSVAVLVPSALGMLEKVEVELPKK